MLIDKIKTRASEVGDFLGGEAPYRSANKGWITDDIYLAWRADKIRKSKDLDQIAKVSVYWQPLIQVFTILLFLISLATLLAFSPIYLMK